MKDSDQSRKNCDAQRDMERLEGGLWATNLFQSSNPALVQCAIFLSGFFELGLTEAMDEIPRLNAEQLTPSQILESEALAHFFSRNANWALSELSEFLPEWCMK
jgi:hypothetical protein